MHYLSDKDYDYIINKYQSITREKPELDTSGTVSQNVSGYGADRFFSNEEIYSEGSGLTSQEILEGILENDEKIKDLPHAIRKAQAFRFVLENTKIDCDERDMFPAICAMDRPLNKTLIYRWKKEVFENKIPEIERERARLEEAGAVTIWIDFDHCAPNYERLFAYGVRGVLAEAKKAKSELMKKQPLTEEQKAFYEAIEIEYDAFVAFLYRLADKAKDKNSKLHDALVYIAENPPKTFYHCLLLTFIYFITLEHIEGMQSRSLSNFDRVFLPYYLSDIEEGKEREELARELAYFLMQFQSINNYWGQPLFLGGENADGTAITNELSYLLLDVYDKLGLYNPKLQIKLSQSMPKAFVMKALEMIRGGNNSIVFVCDATIRRALVNCCGATEEEARLCNVTGCYEYSVQDSVPFVMLYTNLMKPFEYTISGGYDGVTGEFCGLKTTKDFKTFDDFYKVYLEHLGFCMSRIFDITHAIMPYNSEINPQPLLAPLFKTSVERGLDPLHGGAANSSTNLALGFIANAADSLHAVRELVFENGEYTVAELKAILDANFRGHEDLRSRMLNKMQHYGNNLDGPDEIARDIVRFIKEYVGDRTNIYGGKWSFGFHVARQSYDQGLKTAASPDGRLFGEELSKNVSASMGRNTKGPTAAILSAVKLGASNFAGDACLDLGIHPTAVKGEDGLEAMYGMVRAFEAMGGHALHINVFDAQTLRAAQKEPEKYTDLQIRVCGWNVLFNNINKVEQDEFIRQAEALY